VTGKIPASSPPRRACASVLQEIELKFQVPSARCAALRRAVDTTTARHTRLQARYLDTPDGHLARGRVALRLRHEGSHWVQTVKAEGDGPMRRLEHEVPLAPEPGEPVLDLRRHLGTPAADALARALGLSVTDLAARAGAGDGLGLGVCFETDIHRTHRVLRVAGGRVELAFDEGQVRAAGRSLPVCELEMELCDGSPAALVALARRWVARHGLWLDGRSKAERGALLAKGQWASPPALAIDPSAGLTSAQHRAALRTCLTQVLANASVLGDPALQAWLAGGTQAAYLQPWRAGLRSLHTHLSAGQTELATALAALVQALDQGADPAAVARGPAFNDAMLSLLDEA